MSTSLLLNTTLGFGYPPHIIFRYILETGAGWKDTIGSGEIVVVLPYEASLENIVFDEYSHPDRFPANADSDPSPRRSPP